MHKIIGILGHTAVGKTFVSNHLLEKYNLQYVPSVTTRPKREIGNGNYKHVSHEQFEKMIKEGKFFEYTVFNGWYYGTLRGDLDAALDKNHTLYTISPDKAKELKERMPGTVLICLTYPEPLEENIVKRLKSRGHTEAEINKKLETVESDSQHIKALVDGEHLDFIIESIQGDETHTLKEAEKIIDKVLND